MSSEISEISKISEQLQSSQCGIIHDAPETVYEITPEMIEAELKWEDECSDAGYKYALAAAQHLVENRQAALTSAGVCLVSRNIVAVADHLSAWLKEMETKPGRKSLAAVCLNRINPLKAAAIALREMVPSSRGS